MAENEIQMNKIVLSFKPGVFPALLTKEKAFEYRSRIPAGETEAFLYLSAPVKMIVGGMHLAPRLKIAELLSECDESVRERLVRHQSEGSVYCSPILSLSLFACPLTLAEARALEPGFRAPQGYLYIEKFPRLCAALEGREQAEYAVNPAQSREKLGLFSDEITERYSRQIPVPDDLREFFTAGGKNV